MPKGLIQEIVEAFGKGAALVKRAGFDMVLVHGGHGWLLHQFFSLRPTKGGTNTAATPLKTAPALRLKFWIA